MYAIEKVHQFIESDLTTVALAVTIGLDFMAASISVFRTDPIWRGEIRFLLRPGVQGIDKQGLESHQSWFQSTRRPPAKSKFNITNHHDNELFDDHKYYFPLGTLTHPQQPGLEVAPERDEHSSTPGLQPMLQDEQRITAITTIATAIPIAAALAKSMDWIDRLLTLRAIIPDSPVIPNFWWCSSGYGSDSPIVSNTTSNGTSPDMPSSTPISAPIKSIKTNSRLAVTGYRTKTDYSIRLFYQEKDNQLRFVDKESAGANWTESATILDNLPYQPKINGSIAAGSYLFDDPAIAENTKISSFFPYLVSQDADNLVRWTVMHGQNTSNLSAPWLVNDTKWDVKASKGGSVVVLPIAQDVRNAGGIVYRLAEGMLSVKIHDESDPSNGQVAWRKGALSKEIPSNTSIGAFSVLYQDNDGTIQVVWQDDNTWKGPETYDALKEADLGTDITCLTPGAYDAANIGISREQDMNRCFFMSGIVHRKEERGKGILAGCHMMLPKVPPKVGGIQIASDEQSSNGNKST
ncbi:hypothetical protein M434DRAFT_16388 [Hypoxylon sp. CO27-5]|nr:hypothetical protein M434DRAFT_16388 [Hypoxylon sp. CO27-5]